MRMLTRTILVLLTAALVTLTFAGQAGTRTAAESVTCSSTTVVPGVNLTGKWKDNYGQVYSLFQKGSCLWWTSRSSNLFFGTVFGSTVTGIWADVSLRRSYGLTLVILSSGKTLIRRGFASSVLPTNLSRVT